ncbi:MAG: putative internalin, partial [Polyangiaceae bacterium]|nr:putative internalin [Polyangiaceae bacterium]
GNVNGGTESGGTESGGTESGGTESGGTESGGTASAGDGSGATAATDGEAEAGAESNGRARAGQTDWQMQGGGCSVSAPEQGSWGSVLALFIAGAVWARRRRRLAAALAASPLALGAGSAHAAGFSQDSYTAPAAPDDLMWTERAGSNPGHLRPFARLTLGYADDPLVLVDANDSDREVRVVDDQFALYGAFGLGLFERAHLAVLMPLYVQSSSPSEAADSVKGTKPGDLGFDGRFTILDRTAPLELALATTLRVPTGDRESFASDGSVSVWPRALVSKQLSESGSLINLSVGPMFRPSNNELGLETGTQMRFSAGALVALTRIFGLTGEIAGGTVTSDPRKRNTPIEGSLGGRLTFSSVVLGTTLGTGLTEGVGSPDWRWLAMLAVPGPFAHQEPPPAEPARVDMDADRDGVTGAADKCPNEAEDKDGFEDDDGCPEADNDVDGVPDTRDKCVGDAEDKDGFEDDDGCPEADNDGDRVPDSADKCPAEPEDLDQWEDDDGCPDSDNDGDGVPDADDKCPNEPETKNGIDDADGCPDLLRVEQGQIRTLEPIYFDTGKASIQARSEPMLLEMANLIRTRADLGTIAIEGHTDSKGNPKNNLKLSKERAVAVRTFLVKAGVAEARLSSDGFGSERPLEDNKTDAGRGKNRRVEFHFAPPTAPGAH